MTISPSADVVNEWCCRPVFGPPWRHCWSVVFGPPFRFSELFVALAVADYEMSLPGTLGDETARYGYCSQWRECYLFVCLNCDHLARQEAYINPLVSGQCRRTNFTFESSSELDVLQ